MARLAGQFEWPEKTGEMSWNEYDAAQAEALERVEGRFPVIAFPVADGKALYAVYKRAPLTLIHIPYMDAYQIPEAHIEGLRLADVDAMLAREAAWKKMVEEARAEAEAKNGGGAWGT